MCQLTLSYSEVTARLPEIVGLHTEYKADTGGTCIRYQTFINAVRSDGVRHVRILAH